MTTTQPTLFERLNAPFPYADYQYDRFGERCYISGQSITERLNEVLGVGFWKYRGLYDTEKIVQDHNGKNARVKIYVEFSFFNKELQEWVIFIDAGSEQIKSGMNEGDATKSAITDGMKKCASRLGVASDLYKGLITWDAAQQHIVVPVAYQAYYEQKGWQKSTPVTTTASSSPASTSQEKKKQELTQKLKDKSTNTINQMKEAWHALAGNMDGFMEWVEKKRQEQVTDQQMLQMLKRKQQEKKAVSA